MNLHQNHNTGITGGILEMINILKIEIELANFIKNKAFNGGAINLSGNI